MIRTKYNCFAIFCFLFVCTMALTGYFVFVPRVLFRTHLISIRENRCNDYIALRQVKVSGNVTALFTCSPEDDRANATCIIPYPINSTVYVVGRFAGSLVLVSASVYTLVLFTHLTFACTLGTLVVFCIYSLCIAYNKGRSYAYLDTYESPKETTILY